MFFFFILFTHSLSFSLSLSFSFSPSLSLSLTHSLSHSLPIYLSIYLYASIYLSISFSVSFYCPRSPFTCSLSRSQSHTRQLSKLPRNFFSFCCSLILPLFALPAIFLYLLYSLFFYVFLPSLISFYIVFIALSIYVSIFFSISFYCPRFPSLGIYRALNQATHAGIEDKHPRNLYNTDFIIPTVIR